MKISPSKILKKSHCKNNPNPNIFQIIHPKNHISPAISSHSSPICPPKKPTTIIYYVFIAGARNH